MNTLSSLLLALACCAPALASGVKKEAAPQREPSALRGHYYRVQLSDKRGCGFSLARPERYLSAKSLQRRERQHIGVDSTDLPVSARYIEGLRREGVEPVGQSRWNNTVLVQAADTSVAAALRSLPYVTGVTRVFSAPDSVEVKQPYQIVRDTTAACADPYGLARAQTDQIGGSGLHSRGFRGHGMTIGIIDGGYMNADKIPALSGVRVLGTRDCVPPYRGNVYDMLSHGTMVLSCMAAVDSSKYIGTAPEAEYWLLRSEYGPAECLLEEDTWAMAAEYADSVGVDVINSSLGYAHFDDTSTSHRYADLDGRRTLISRTASMLADKGIVLVCSAGNSGRGTWKKITPPGDARDVLTVGAVDSLGMNTTFSSLGPSQDGRVKPDIMARGGGAYVVGAAGQISAANGTSFASPIACGMVACLWQSMPEKTAREIIDLVRRSADRWQEPDNVFGYGLPDFSKIGK